MLPTRPAATRVHSSTVIYDVVHHLTFTLTIQPASPPSATRGAARRMRTPPPAHRLGTIFHSLALAIPLASRCSAEKRGRRYY